MTFENEMEDMLGRRRSRDFTIEGPMDGPSLEQKEFEDPTGPTVDDFFRQDERLFWQILQAVWMKSGTLDAGDKGNRPLWSLEVNLLGRLGSIRDELEELTKDGGPTDPRLKEKVDALGRLAKRIIAFLGVLDPTLVRYEHDQAVANTSGDAARIDLDSMRDLIERRKERSR